MFSSRLGFTYKLVDLSEDQLQTAAAIEDMCAKLWRQRPQARCFGHLRVRSAGRVRDLLLGAESFLAGEVAVIDWERAPLAEVFFAYAVDDEYELELDDGRSLTGRVLARSVLTVAEGALVAVDDGELRLVRADASAPWTGEQSRLRSPLRPREAGARSKVSSPIEVELDAVQRGAVELPDDRSLLILGEAGFGKTTVALHRLAALRRRARERGEPFSALVLVPTRGLRRLLKALLERLDVRDAEVASFADWVADQGRRVFPDLPERDSVDAPLAVARVKRHPALRALLPKIVAGTAAMREVEAGYRDDERERTGDQLLHLFGDRALLDELRARSQAGPAPLGPRMIEQVLEHTKVQFSPTTEHAHAHVDADKLRTVDGAPIDAGTPQQDAETLDPEDFPVLFELLRLRTGGDATAAGELQRYRHIVVDEAQEFAAIELAVVGRAVAPGGSVTVAGDEHQQVDETIAFSSWAQVLAELGVEDRCARVTLEHSYRCPPAVEAFARGLFASLPEAAAPDGDDPALCRSHTAHELETLALLSAALLELRQRDRLASVAVVCRYAASARRVHALLSRGVDCRLVVDGDFRFGPGISVSCVDEVKGLEFDYVIVPDASAANYPADPEGRRALYVAATRAMSRLWLLGSGRPSPLL